MMKRLLLIFVCMVLLMGFAACQKEKNLNMEDVYSKMCKAATLPPMLELDQDLMLDYCGIKVDDTKQAKVLICEDSLRTDEIWLVEANDEKCRELIRFIYRYTQNIYKR